MCTQRMQRGAKEDVVSQNFNGDTPLHVAAYYERAVAVNLLLAAGASIDPLNKNGQTPLATALIRLDRSPSVGREELIKLLLERGADPSKVKGIVVPPWCLISPIVIPSVRQEREQKAIQANLRSDQWSCTACTFANEKNARECSMCGTARPVFESVEPWVCKACTFHNEPNAKECEMCGTGQ
jgi:uncharacterized protein